MPPSPRRRTEDRWPEDALADLILTVSGRCGNVPAFLVTDRELNLWLVRMVKKGGSGNGLDGAPRLDDLKKTRIGGMEGTEGGS